MNIKLYTIGFTKKDAETFFERLKSSGVKRVIDIRLNNVSQLAGFAKKNDLKYFLKTICGIEYFHYPVLAPTQDILDEFKKQKGDWKVYEKIFLKLMKDRQIELNLPKEIFDEACLLCSEDTPEHCHRRLVAEYLNQKWDGEVEIMHL